MTRIRRIVVNLFMRVQEPRVIRIFHFGIYLTLAVAGIMFLTSPQSSVVGAIGLQLAINLSAALALGGVLGAVSVLPGIWWVERLAIISLASGMLMYLVVLFALQTSAIPVGITVALILSLALRWIEVRKYQHAPGK